MLPSVLVLSKSILARRAIAETLRTAGFTVVEADGVEEAHALLSHFTPDAAVIDADNCRAEVDNSFGDTSDIQQLIPISILLIEQSPKNGSADARRDGRLYVGKPFRAHVLVDALARALNVRPHFPTSTFRLGPLTFNAAQRRATLDHDGAVRVLDLSPVQLRLLEFLISAPDTIHTRDEIEQAVWPGEQLEARTVDQAVVRLRRELDQFDSAAMLKTVRGVGYRLTDASRYSHPEVHARTVVDPLR